MISAAVKAARGIKILSVSLLSHHEQKSINEIGIKNSLKNEIKKLINNALKNIRQNENVMTTETMPIIE